jgi:hypothetical protein
MTGKQAFPHNIHCNPHLSIERTAGVFDSSGKKEIRNMFSVINGFYSVSSPSPSIAAVKDRTAGRTENRSEPRQRR